MPKDVAIEFVEQRLERVHLVVGEIGDLRIGKAAEDQVGLAHAAMPGPEMGAPPAHVQPSAGRF